MSKLTNSKSGRRLNFENLEAREYLSVDGWAPPISEIEIGPVSIVSSQGSNSTKGLAFDTTLVEIPSSAQRDQTQELDELFRDIHNDLIIADGLASRPDSRAQLSESRNNFVPPPPRANDLSFTIYVSIGAPLSTSGIPISHEYDGKPENRPQPPLAFRFNLPAQDIIASYGASLISSSNASTKSEITTVSLSSSSFKLAPNSQQVSTTDYEADVVANRQAELSNKTPDSNALLQSLEEEELRSIRLSQLEQLLNELAQASLGAQAVQPEFKSQSSVRSHNNLRSSESDLKDGDGLIALSTSHDLLPTVPTNNISPSLAWTQRVATSQSLQALRSAPRSSERAGLSAQKDEEVAQEPHQANQYWAVVPLALSMFAIDWFRRHWHFRKQKTEDCSLVMNPQTH